MKRAIKFLKILLTVPLALAIAGYATVVAEVMLDDYYKPIPQGFKPESVHCPCWDPENVSGLYAALWKLDDQVKIVHETIGPAKLGYKLTLIDAWENYTDGNCLRAGVITIPKEKVYACDVAWGLWNGESCDIEAEDLFEASSDNPLVSRSCEIAANETIGYILTVAE